jgi:hypothetical protein
MTIGVILALNQDNTIQINKDPTVLISLVSINESRLIVKQDTVIVLIGQNDLFQIINSCMYEVQHEPISLKYPKHNGQLRESR